MPLFGKKSKPKTTGGASYPRQATAYPTQVIVQQVSAQGQYPPQQPGAYPPGAYPPQAGAYPPPTQPGYPPQQGPPPPAGAPPPYTAQPQALPQPQAPPQPQPQPQYPAQPPQPVTVQGTFDQGARFGPDGVATVPPPPPGCAATPAQLAAQRGQSVVMKQGRRDVFGGSDGGYTLF